MNYIMLACLALLCKLAWSFHYTCLSCSAQLVKLAWSFHYVVRELEALLDCKVLQDFQAHQ